MNRLGKGSISIDAIFFLWYHHSCWNWGELSRYKTGRDHKGWGKISI